MRAATDHIDFDFAVNFAKNILGGVALFPFILYHKVWYATVWRLLLEHLLIHFELVRFYCLSVFAKIHRLLN